ncbi:polysaccharide biosynthesis protein [Paenibacillus medicaginis]|uniref:Polysaccharide biosynthesis protein n=1 Tax=Paenibacillus medicaginis TaxID=1470560 RepID=A0ABV5C1V2_9BACL
MFNNSVIMVTGGTGSWGRELVTQLLLHNPKKIIIYSRNESNQVKMNLKFNDPRLSFCIGDIRDPEALISACQDVDYVFHMAALKHVNICEEQPNEALKTNIIGTQNVINAAAANGVKKVINISTDKASDPANFYGMTKAIAEKLIIYANTLHTGTRFVNVRGGNILGSSGSVLHLFITQLKENGQIGITDREMVRFFMTTQSATELVLTAAKEGKGGETFVLMMNACKITDLAEVLIETYGIKDAKIVHIGTRPGEKLTEILLSEYESRHAAIYNNRYFVVLPEFELPELKNAYASCPSEQVKKYVSAANLMSKQEIRQMLEDGGFISAREMNS